MSGWGLGGIAALGAFHGVNPAMGWLFAVAIGFRERSRGALAVALAVIVAGHAASVGLTLGLLQEARSIASDTVVRGAGAGLLVSFAAWKLLSNRAHLRFVGMRIRLWELALWSFLMSTAHGAGLMLFPFLLSSGRGADVTGLGLVVHTLGMAAVASALAFLVYEVLGVGVLRSAWLNLDRLWVYALAGGAAATLLVN